MILVRCEIPCPRKKQSSLVCANTIFFPQAEDRPDPAQSEQGGEPPHDFEFTIPINQLEPEQGMLRVRVRKRPGLDFFLEEVADRSDPIDLSSSWLTTWHPSTGEQLL